MLLERKIVRCVITVFFSFFRTYGDHYNVSGYHGEQMIEYINDTGISNDYSKIEHSHSVEGIYGKRWLQYSDDRIVEYHEKLISGWNNNVRDHTEESPCEYTNDYGSTPFDSVLLENVEQKNNGRSGNFEYMSGSRDERDYRAGRRVNTISSDPRIKMKRPRRRSSQSPLVLTQYINQKDLSSGRRAAKVEPLIGKIKSYSGFFEVNEQYKSYMFFWYFRPEMYLKRDKPQEVPVIVWLEGGMGHSSMLSALRSNGPIRLERNGSLTHNEYSWAKTAHLVYFDSPVGAGFSFTIKHGYSKNNREVAENLYRALEQYVTLFRLAKNPLYIAGQSYAGKYIIALGVKIDKEKKRFNINFQGAAIGNGFIDPPNMLRYGAYLYQLGFIDAKQRERFREINKLITSLLKNGKDKEALTEYENWIIGDMTGKRVPLLAEIVGLYKTEFRQWLMDYRQVGRVVGERTLLNNFLNQKSIKTALHTGRIPFTKNNDRCKRALWPGLLKSEVGSLKRLLNNNYSVLLYHGQMSVKNAYPFMVNYVQKMRTSENQKWQYAENYFSAFRNVWIVDGDVAGYFSKGRNFEHLLVRNAGENVPADQPKWAQRMIENFTYRKSLNDHP